MRNPILTLRNLVQEAALASTPEKRANGIVTHVKNAMNVAVCSLYVADEEGTLVLVATDGLNPASVGSIRLRPGEGLVGMIAQTRHPLNLQSAGAHPQFRYFPDSGEERFEAFLGAPVVHAGRLAGVLVVEQQDRRKFSEEEESFLATVAAHVGALSPADFLPEVVEGPVPSGGSGPTRRFSGVSASPGVGIGRAVLLTAEANLMTVADSETSDPEGELRHFREAVEATLAELAAGQRQLAGSIPDDLVEVFSIYEMLLRSADFAKAVEGKIELGSSAASALRSVVSDYATRFEAMDDAYFQARSEDIRALGSRVYSRLSATTHREIGKDEKIVLVGRLVSIADIAKCPIEQLAGIASEEGSTLSHTALLAKALGVPAVMGIELHGDLSEDAEIIVDGYQGRLLVSPSPEVRAEYERLMEYEQLLSRHLAKLTDKPAVTPDGKRIHLLANTGLLADITPGLARGAEGVGLYRSEIPFMVRDAFPSEEEQVEVYRTVLEAYRGMPVYMRTLDVGGDKPLPYFPIHEENPALGWRGVRFTLDNSAVFMTQVRAMLRASAGLGNLSIMLPLISSVAEVESFVLLLEDACMQLASEQIEVIRPKVGIMAEVPAVAGILPFLKGTIDFISIGSNDLSQYTLAVDRNNARVSGLFDHLHPGVLDVIEDIAQRAAALDLGVSVCGDMASDPCGAVLLLGMGIETFSMPAFSIPRIKWLLRTVPFGLAREQLELARTTSSARASRARLCAFLEGLGLHALLEPERAVTS